MYSENLKNLESKLYNPLPIPIIGRILQKKAIIDLAENSSSDSLKILTKAVTRFHEHELKEIILDSLNKTAIALVRNGSPDDVKILAKTITLFKERRVIKIILASLSSIEKQECIDSFCEVWATSRHKDLTLLLMDKKWTAFKPYNVMVLTILKTNQIYQLDWQSLEKNEKVEAIVDALLKSTRDKDREISSRASQRINNLTCTSFSDIDLIYRICQKWEKTRDKFLEQIVCKNKYVTPYNYSFNSTACYNPSFDLLILTALKTDRLDVIHSWGREAIEPLLKASNDQDIEIAGNARRCLCSLTSSDAVDAFCDQWSRNRNKFSEQILCQSEYVAQEPVELKVLTALKVGKFQVIQECEGEIVEPLLKAFNDRDREIANNARKCAAALTNTDAIDAFCEQWSRNRGKFLEQILFQRKYIAQEPIELKVLSALKVGNFQIIQECGQKIIKPLLKAFDDRDKEIVDNAKKLIVALTDFKVIDSSIVDYICQKWSKTRDPILEQWICREKYVAQEPVELRVLTALKTNNKQTIVEQGAEIISLLLKAYKDTDSVIVNNAQSALQSILENAEAQKLFVSLIADPQNWIAREISEAVKFTPRDPHQRALFYFLTEQWNKYESLDFEHTLLQVAYQEGNEQLRRTIIQKIRLTGRVKWLKIITGGNQKKRLCDMTDSEWKTALTILDNCKQWQEMWQLAQKSPAIWSKQLLQRLKRIAWQPKVEEQAIFKKLIHLADLCPRNFPSLGKLFHEQDISNVEVLKIKKSNISDNFSPDGKLFANSFVGKTIYETIIKLWQIHDGKLLTTILTEHTRSIHGITFIHDGKLLASYNNTDDRTIKLWQIPDGKLLTTIPDANSIPTFSSDNKLLAVCNNYSNETNLHVDETVKIWQIPDGKLLASIPCFNFCNLPIHSPKYTSLYKFSPDSKLFAIRSKSNDNKIELWQMPDAQLLTTLTGHVSSVFGIAFSPDGKLLASCSRDGAINLWQMPNGKLLTTLTNHASSVYRIIFSSDGKFLASGSRSCYEERMQETINLWQISNGKLLTTLTSYDASNFEFSPDSHIFAAYSYHDKTIQLWQTLNGKLLITLGNYTADFVHSITFSPDSKLIVCQSGSKMAIWCTVSGLHLKTYHNISSDRIIFSPDSQQIAVGGNNYCTFFFLVSSYVFQLSRSSINKLSQQNREYIEETLKNGEITEEERHWLEFMQGLLNWHQRFDVDIEDAPQLISTGEFDIEIAG